MQYLAQDIAKKAIKDARLARTRKPEVEIWRKPHKELCQFPYVGATSPSNTVSLGPRPTSVLSGILIHPTVWRQYTNVTDRTDRTTVSQCREKRETLVFLILMVAAIPACQSVHAKTLDHLRGLFGDSYLITKFRGHPICHFEIIAILSLRQFGLKMSIHAQKNFWRGMDLTSLYNYKQ